MVCDECEEVARSIIIIQVLFQHWKHVKFSFCYGCGCPYSSKGKGYISTYLILNKAVNMEPFGVAWKGRAVFTTPTSSPIGPYIRPTIQYTIEILD